MMKVIIGYIIAACLFFAFIKAIQRYAYPETTNEYKKGYEQCIQDIEKQHQIDSLDALYNEMFKNGLKHIGTWSIAEIELNRRKTDSIFNKLCNLKAELK